ncbi:uncharacterized protein LOC110030248 [Phalaenopsis equestris]|uniref:uncharacterized protein LOC110030248 n=1 Tax=Phalaenopsis equestris TaxID=78828 RepID=UPI0009E18C3A|nr:uncharacterized protein LOC110030248 [Phalaenopsis equestris]
MAKNGKLNKLTRMIKRWNSSNRIHRTGDAGSGRSDDEDTWHAGNEVPPGYHEVYVGKSRRRYILSSDLVDRPLFKNLVNRSSGGVVGATVVDCEVVLFEHLLWMLETAEPQPESFDELVDFYAC